jgi:hypothetical protein
MATPTDAPTNALPGIEITDDIVKSEREFAAEITVDENLNGDYGPQWHFTLTQTPTSTFTDDEIAAIVSVVAGETEASATAKAARSKLPQNLKASVLSGTAIPALISQGKLALDGDKLVDASAAA